MGNKTFNLNQSEAAELRKPINGNGGMQSFGRKLQSKLQANGTITLNDEEVGRIIRHISYKPGGFEDRLDRAFSRSIKEILN